ncbi:MAG TPA: hypothetical protein PKY88_05835 [Anaerohalosphaeraceae bacterium]|nr:hypothetical protein [Anaerohalosphaeraceae bacterium]
MGRLLFLLMVFGAGFATALYLVAPVDDSQAMCEQAMTERLRDRQQMREDLLALSCKIRLGMNQLISFAEEKSAQLAEYMRQEAAKKQAESGI